MTPTPLSAHHGNGSPSTCRLMSGYGGCNEVTGAMARACASSCWLRLEAPIQHTLPSFCNAAKVVQPSSVSFMSSAG